MKQTPAERNEQYEIQSRRIVSQVCSGASSHTLFAADSSSLPKGKGKKKNPDAENGSDETRHRQRRGAQPVQRVNESAFYFGPSDPKLPPTCISNPPLKFS